MQCVTHPPLQTPYSMMHLCHHLHYALVPAFPHPFASAWRIHSPQPGVSIHLRLAHAFASAWRIHSPPPGACIHLSLAHAFASAWRMHSPPPGASIRLVGAQFDVAVLISGDRDFVPALVRTRQKGANGAQRRWHCHHPESPNWARDPPTHMFRWRALPSVALLAPPSPPPPIGKRRGEHVAPFTLTLSPSLGPPIQASAWRSRRFATRRRWSTRSLPLI